MMAETFRNDVDLKPIIVKLGHQLEEIRVRALENILSKLNHGVISEVDLVQEKQLFIRLLEWFNYDSCPKQKEVFNVLARLVKHESAAGIVRDVGGIEFLTELRANVSSNLHTAVDSILDCLFHLPSRQTPANKKQCVFKTQEHRIHEESHHSESRVSTHQDSHDATSLTADSRVPQGSTNQGRQYQPPPEPQFGYFTQTSTEKPSIQTASRPVTVLAQCFRFSTFPWVALTITDRHVLTSTESSLNGRDESLIISGCEFISDVILQDFPAEVFLQRPTIVKSLLSLLSAKDGGNIDMALHAIHTLSCFTHRLAARILYYQDPAFFTPKQDYKNWTVLPLSEHANNNSASSVNTRPSLIGQETRYHGDGQDGDNHTATPRSSSSLSQEYTDGSNDEMEENLESLQFLQWTVPQFCVEALHRAVSMLTTPHERLISETLKLLRRVSRMLADIVLPDLLWSDPSVTAREMCESLQESIEILNSSVYHHYHGNMGASCPGSELVTHRVAYIGIAGILTHLIQVLVPLDKCSKALPEGSEGVLALLVQDESLSYSASNIRDTLLPFLQNTDPTEYELYHKAAGITQSMAATCSFLSSWPDKAGEQIVELVKQAEASLPSLVYHLHLPLVKAIVDMTSHIFSRTSPSPVACAGSQLCLLRLLAHPLPQVRKHAYHTCLKVIKESLGVNQVTKPASTAHQRANFVIPRDVLYEICSFGMADEETSKPAAEMLLYLLQSQLLLPKSKWQQLLDTVLSLMPLIQGFSNTETELGKCILGLLSTNTDNHTGAPPMLERFRGVLRLFYLSNPRLRAEAVGRLAYFLTHEADSLYKQPLFSELDVTVLGSLLLLEQPVILQEEYTGKSAFREEGLRQVYEIYSSQTVEPKVKKSAASQLALMLHDKSMHKHFTSQGGIELTLDLLQTGVRKPVDGQNPARCLLPALVKILRLLVQHDADLRHRLAHEPYIYYAAVRAALLNLNDQICKQETSMLLAFLLFDEVASIEIVSSDEDDFLGDLATETIREDLAAFSLPLFIGNKYKLPFKCVTHHNKSPHSEEGPPDYDPLMQGALAEMQKYGWSKAWYSKVEDVVRACRQGHEAQKQFRGLFNEKLLLNSVDRIILPASHFPSAIQLCVHDIENATNHAMAGKVMQRLSSYLVAGQPHGINQLLYAANLKKAISRFFKVIPSSSADEQLLTEVLHLFCILMENEATLPSDLLTWLFDLLHDPQGALMGALSKPENLEDASESVSAVHRKLNRKVLQFIQCYIGKVPYNLLRNIVECVQGELVSCSIEKLQGADATHFYNLASLESSLLCLMHITARPQFSKFTCSSSSSFNLCQEMLGSLLQVVSAFHIGRGGSAMSYMGRGVTRCAAMCLRHLAYDMVSSVQDQEWPRQWLLMRDAAEETDGEQGFHWLTPLWTYRDAEVRAAGLGIAVALASTETGCLTLTTQCQHITGGIWGAAIKVLLDQSECSIVREQACLLLVNMTSHPIPSGTTSDVWQGPIIRNEETYETLVGVNALVTLLHHCNFYHEVLAMQSNYYPQPAIHPVSVASDFSSSPLSSHLTMTTSGTASPGFQGLHSSQAVASTPEDLHSSGRPQTADMTSQPIYTARSTQTTSTAASVAAHAGDNSSEASVSTYRENLEYQSVVTPCLLSAICQLLGNLVTLVPEDTLASLQKHDIIKIMLGAFDANLCKAYMAELRERVDQRQYLVAFRDVLKLQSSILKLLQLCILHQPQLRVVLTQEKSVLTQIVKLLSVTYPDADTEVVCERLWQQIFTTLILTLQTGGHKALIDITPVLIKEWHIIAGRCNSILEEKSKIESDLWLTTLTYIAVTLAEEGQRPGGKDSQDGQYNLADLLDTHISNGDEAASPCSGTLLCKALIKSYDTVALRSHEHAFPLKQAVVNALKSVLALSVTAKLSALEAGLVESLCEQLKSLHLKLTMEVLEGPQVLQSYKKDSHPLVIQIMLILDLLRNFLYNSHDVKLAAYETGLSGLLHKLWAWGQVDNSLMISLLSLLATYTAKCPQACSSLSSTSSQTLDKAVTGSSSLVHCLIKLVQRESNALSKSGNLSILKLAFSVLATLTLTAECRGIMWKSNFLHEFAQLSPQKTKKSKAVKASEALWLDLFLNLSFSNDGQNMILKISESLSLLLEFGASSSAHYKHCAALIIRNLCFQNNNKPKLLAANEKLLPYLLDCLEATGEQVQLIASSALLALVYNNQKAKVQVKTNTVMRRLQETYNQLLNTTTPNDQTSKTVENIHNTLLIIKG